MKTFTLTALAVVVAMAALAASALGASKTFTVTLSGKQETPKGSPTGKGTAKLVLNSSTGRVCFNLTYSGIGTPTAAHIHQGKKGVAGPVVIPIFGGTPKKKGCVKASKSLIGKILKSPTGYYFNIHTAKYPGGALRGQL